MISPNWKHGHSHSPTYISWKSMKARCKDPRKKHYAARGITVCRRWQKFTNFLSDMGERPQGKTLERRNGRGNYNPQNCKWATLQEQAQNRRYPEFKAPYRLSKRNTSGVVGVTWDEKHSRWMSSGTLKGKRVYLYLGPSFDKACKARRAFLCKKESIRRITK